MDKLFVMGIGIIIILFIAWFFFGDNQKTPAHHEHNH